ncbi:MAG: hypothetical protein HYY16_06845 [Planctomycetes bacterium]|nr:hypothetical protein [Planctomycetota bacterium]
MKIFGWSLFLGCLLAAGCVQRQTRPLLTIDEIVALHEAGVSEDVIIAKIEGSRIDKKLSTEDIIALKRKGLGDKTLAALVRATSPRPEPERTVIVERYYPPGFWWYGHWYHRWWF